ncbi:MAG: hypothetical protein K6G12_10010 [Lachnospiraceae bacterium]|nr:hypothetical protein [Lachnospiraceae bacterium]
MKLNQNFSLIVRILVGAYLLYADYSVYDDMLLKTGAQKILLIAVMLLFLVAGVALIVTSLRSLYASSTKKDDEDKE